MALFKKRTSRLDRKIQQAVAKITPAISGAAVAAYKEKYNISAYTGTSTLFGSSRSSGAKWPNGMSSHINSLHINHFASRMNAREIMHDVPQARSMVERFADSEVDIGIKVEPTPDPDILGITPEHAEAWGEDSGKRFDLWARSKKSHRSRIMTFYQAQRLYALWQQRDSDMFTRLHYSLERDVSNPLQFQFIDPNQIRGFAYTNNYMSYVQSDGITRDDRGRETSYKVWIQSQAEGTNKGKFKDITIPARGSKSGRIFMLHGYSAEYAGQGRGYSRLAHALQDLENITDFTSAQLKKAINQSSMVGFIEPSENNPSSNPFADMPAGPQTVVVGETEYTVKESEALDFCDIPEAATRIPGSAMIANLKEGEKIKFLEGTAPSETFETFVDAVMSYLSSSLGIPLEVVLMKFNQNYSASRAALILFWRVANIWQQEMDADLISPIYEMFIAEEIAAGNIQAPGWSDPLYRDAWLMHSLITAPMPNIDPMKTAKADETYIGMGATTLDRVARELNGSSGKANRLKLKREYEELPASPFKKSAPAAGSTATTEESNPKPHKDDDKNEAVTPTVTPTVTNDEIMEVLEEISDKILMEDE